MRAAEPWLEPTGQILIDPDGVEVYRRFGHAETLEPRRHAGMQIVRVSPSWSHSASGKAGRSVYFSSLADIVTALAKAERDGALRDRIRYYCRFALLIVDEIGYLPVTPGGGNLFFQLVNARYEKGAMILTSNRGFAEWGDIASPRRRHPDRRIELSAARTRRPLTRSGPLQTQRRNQPRPAHPETSPVGRQRTEAPITRTADRQPARLGNFAAPLTLTHHVHILEMNGESYRLKQSAGRRRAARAEQPKAIARPDHAAAPGEHDRDPNAASQPS